MYQVVEVADEVNPHLSDRQQRVLDDIVDRRYQMGALLGNQYDQ
jgi:hypothetical protein